MVIKTSLFSLNQSLFSNGFTLVSSLSYIYTPHITFSSHIKIYYSFTNSIPLLFFFIVDLWVFKKKWSWIFHQSCRRRCTEEMEDLTLRGAQKSCRCSKRVTLEPLSLLLRSMASLSLVTLIPLRSLMFFKVWIFFWFLLKFSSLLRSMCCLYNGFDRFHISALIQVLFWVLILSMFSSFYFFKSCHLYSVSCMFITLIGFVVILILRSIVLFWFLYDRIKVFDSSCMICFFVWKNCKKWKIW